MSPEVALVREDGGPLNLVELAAPDGFFRLSSSGVIS